MSPLNALATSPVDETRTYGDVIHVVHIYVVEPHPEAPDVSPYGARVWEGAYSDGHPQPLMYEDRVAYAREVERELEGTQLLLVDELAPERSDNPAWCTYGTCPNCAYLIGQDGIIRTYQEWLDVGQMQKAVDRLLDE